MRYALAMAVLLCGCGRETTRPPAGSGPEPQATQPARPAEPIDNRPVIVAFGDSLTAGFGVDPGRSYPEFLQRELDRRGYRYRVINQGSSGDTSSGGLARVALVTELKPEIVIVEFGANDGLRGQPVASTRENLDRMIAILLQGGARVVLAGMTLPPNYGPDYIRSFENVYRDLARKHNAPLIPFLLEGVGGTTQYMQSDGLHPNAAGNRRVADVVLKAIEPLLHK